MAAEISTPALTRIVALTGGLMLAAVLAGCGPSAKPIDATTQPSSSSPLKPETTPEPTDDVSVLAATFDLTQGNTTPAVNVKVAEGTTAKTLDSATTRLVTTIEGTVGVIRIEYQVEVPADTQVTSLSDGTVAVTTAAGDLLLGFVAPERSFTDIVLGNATDPFTDVAPQHALLGTKWRIHPATGAGGSAGHRTVLLSQTVSPTGATSQVAAVYGTHLIATTKWTTRGEGGKSLQVSPTYFGRLSGEVAMTYAAQELKTLRPETATGPMEKQLRCHLIGARGKTTWNLEPWRPDVSEVEYLLARCNPS